MVSKFQYLLIIFPLLYRIAQSTFHESTSQRTGLKLAIHCKDTFPLYPVYLGNTSDHERSNTSSIWFTSLNEVNVSKIVASVGYDKNFFMVQLCIGNPIQLVYLNLDTSTSPLTWTQCKGGQKYIQKVNPHMYDERKSHSYRKVPMNNPVCKHRLFTTQKNECVYNISYPSGSYVRGVASFERFQFLTKKDCPVTYVDDIIFGCTTEMKNVNYGDGTGTLSMNRSPLSLITQLKTITGGRFSYCLVLTSGRQSYLTFGDDIVKGKSKVQTMPLVQHPNHPYAYAVELIGLNIGDIQMKSLKEVFGKSTLFLIDIGTIATSINRSAYIRIRKVLANRFDKFRLVKTSVTKFNFCYSLRAGLDLEKVLVPITLRFRGAVFKIPAEKSFVVNSDKSSFCLALTPTDGPNILGAMQQHNMMFTFDINKGRVSFSQEDCSARDKH